MRNILSVRKSGSDWSHLQLSRRISLWDGLVVRFLLELKLCQISWKEELQRSVTRILLKMCKIFLRRSNLLWMKYMVVSVLLISISLNLLEILFVNFWERDRPLLMSLLMLSLKMDMFIEFSSWLLLIKEEIKLNLILMLNLLKLKF